jgi:hypothetical protein
MPSNAVLAASFRQNTAGTVDKPKPKATGHPIDCPFSLAHFKSIPNVRCPRSGTYYILFRSTIRPATIGPVALDLAFRQEKVFEGHASRLPGG